jgi:hypothetical protein
MRVRIRVRTLYFTLLLLCGAAIAAALGYAYSYVTDSNKLAALIRQESPRFFPGSVLTVAHVQPHLLGGEVTLAQVVLRQNVDGKSFPTVQVPWLNIKSDVQEITHGKVQLREVRVAQPTLRLRRRKDGTWNLAGLLADPWPGPAIAVEPVIIINSGRVELVDDTGEMTAVLLRDLSARIEPLGGGLMHLEASALGDAAFGRLVLEGTFDRHTGRLVLSKVDLSRLAVTEALRQRLPVELRAALAKVGLSGGEVDIRLKSLVYDPASSPSLLHYSGSVLLRGGTWNCPVHLPFPLFDVEALARIEDGQAVIEYAEGRNGKTLARARGQLSAADPMQGPMDLTFEILGLELDERVRAKTPRKYLPLWDEFQPRGVVNLAVRVVRSGTGETPGFGLTVSCQDVAMRYFRFPYALEHVRGTLVWSGRTIRVDMETVVHGGDLVTATGTIENPGPGSTVKLEFRSRAFPINDEFLKALPREVLPVVQQFNPKGSVQGKVNLLRTPPTRSGAKDNVAIFASLDLNEGCEMCWNGLPYPIVDLTGHLELSPHHWEFQRMRGRNGTAVIQAAGIVDEVAPKLQRIGLELHARHLPFDKVLHDALPREWQVSWDTLKPTGSSNVDAQIQVEPGQAPHYHLAIDPEPDSRLHLTITPVTTGATPAPTIVLPAMENIEGSFIFDDGTVQMSDVNFVFREAPVKFKRGTVHVRARGQFDLSVGDLEISKLRLDSSLRRIMPLVMSQFAQRLDDNKPFSAHGNLAIDWSGQAGQPARCSWDHANVVFDDNTVLTGLPLRSIQGQLERVSGWSDGRNLEVRGVLNLESVYLLGQQVTRVSSPLEVKDGWASLPSIRGTLLGGEIRGDVKVSLDASPEYSAHLQLQDADLREYAQSVPGHQQMRGRFSGWLNLGGMGNSLGTLSGEGAAKMTEGDLGQLPLVLRWVKAANFRVPTKTAFHAANLGLKIQNGIATFEPIKFTGDAFSLQGSGTLDIGGNQELDLHLSPLFGRDAIHVPLLSDAMREASGKVFDIHVSGPAYAPTVRAEPLPSVLPRVSEAFRRDAARKGLGRNQ